MTREAGGLVRTLKNLPLLIIRIMEEEKSSLEPICGTLVIRKLMPMTEIIFPLAEIHNNDIEQRWNRMLSPIAKK
jgi:hypothetical protein